MTQNKYTKTHSIENFHLFLENALENFSLIFSNRCRKVFWKMSSVKFSVIISDHFCFEIDDQLLIKRDFHAVLELRISH